VVTELRKRHNAGEFNAGINVRKVSFISCFQKLIVNQAGVSNMHREDVLQPMLVSTSMINLATETVRSILKIDDIVNVVGRG